MSRITNPASPVNVPRVDSAGSITPPASPDVASFIASNLAPSAHPALRGPGGRVAHPAQSILCRRRRPAAKV
jgi:hypothetical protein